MTSSAESFSTPAGPAALVGETPKAITFDTIALSPDIRKAVDALGYVHPTPVQRAVFEPAIQGKNLVVQARTGTGKTAAFGLPIVDSLVRPSLAEVQALILTPTRELALQVSHELTGLSKFKGTKVTPIYGGTNINPQIEALEARPQIVVGTPGRVLDHLRRGTLNASRVRVFVLDEADEMLSMGFAKELNAIIEYLPKHGRQGLYFSATIPPDVERLANKHLEQPEYITLSSDQVGAQQLAHYVYLVSEGDKRSALMEVIDVEDPPSAIIFCNTKDETERLAELLKSRGYDAGWLSGDLEQKERERVMSATREGRLRFLVATDVAARGIDISHVTHVINADFPESAEQYVHRTGRTGRAGRTGTAISLVGPKDIGHLYMLRLTYKIRPVERLLPTAGERKTRAQTDLVNFLADAYVGRTVDSNHLAVARRLLTHENADMILAGLLGEHLGSRAASEVEHQASEARRSRLPPPSEKNQSVPPAREKMHNAPKEAQGEPVQRASFDASARPGRDQRRQRPMPSGVAQPTGDRRPRADGAATHAPQVSPAPQGRSGSPERVALAPSRPVQSSRNHQPQPSQKRNRGGIVQATLSQWQPPADEDDDRPILAGARERAGEPERERRPGRRPTRVRGDAATTPALSPDRSREPIDQPLKSPAPVAHEPPGIDPTRSTIFVNVGRRDGITAADLLSILNESAGIAEMSNNDIRVRDRMTFITVDAALANAAITSLAGRSLRGRTLVAEPARVRT